MSSEAPPPIEAAEAALREAEREHKYWLANEKRLTSAYPNQFVAVIGGEVVAAARALPKLYEALRHADRDPHEAWIRFLSSDRLCLTTSSCLTTAERVGGGSKVIGQRLWT